ncbi:MAG: hypothetical protein ABSC94_16565 [Polyangiaceae bacterium]|jgi:hypothetical protein
MGTRPLILALGLLLGSIAPRSAWARPPVAAVGVAAAEAAPASLAQGVAVVAGPATTDAAWPLAQAVYADAALRATDLDEAHARVLCGEPAAPGAPAELRDLADTVAAIRGEDPPSRAILADLAHRFAVSAVVVVRFEGGQPIARVFLAQTRDFDAATYSPDPGPTLAWSGAVHSLGRSLGSLSPSGQAARLALRDVPRPTRGTEARPFYGSPWFWSAIGLAAAAAGATYFLTRDNGTSAIHLELQVPAR